MTGYGAIRSGNTAAENVTYEYQLDYIVLYILSVTYVTA